MAHTKKDKFKDAVNEDWENRSFVAKERTHSEHDAENTQETHSEHVENTQRTHWDERQGTDLETFSIRLHPEDKRRLAAYFSRRSTPLSQGIRQIIADFMEKTGI